MVVGDVRQQPPRFRLLAGSSWVPMTDGNAESVGEWETPRALNPLEQYLKAALSSVDLILCLLNSQLTLDSISSVDGFTGNAHFPWPSLSLQTQSWLN